MESHSIPTAQAKSDPTGKAEAAPRWRGLRLLAARIAGFGLVSGLGWLIDFTVFGILAFTGVRLFWANLVGAGLAVTFVYFCSVRRVFYYSGHWLYVKFAAYCAYQVVGVLVSSWAVELVSLRLDLPGLLAKVLVTPATFAANFLFMSWLVGRRSSPGAV